MNDSTTLPRAAGAIISAFALAALLTGCGSDEPAADPTVTDTAAAAQGRPGGGMPGRPGTFGTIADVDGDVLQVQSQGSGQVAVTVTDTTTITDQVSAALVDVTEGACVVVRTDRAGDEQDGDEQDGDAARTEVTAASVSISEAGEDGCAAGIPGGPGGPGNGGRGGGDRPTDLPTDVPSDMPGAGREGGPGGGGPGSTGGFGAFGEVTSVTGTGFVVAGMNGDITVTVGADTTYTKQAAADASALTTGRCVQVSGESDDTGAVTADSIQVSDAVAGQCGR